MLKKYKNIYFWQGFSCQKKVINELPVVKKIAKYFLAGILAVNLAPNLSAQHPRIYNQFFMNPYVYNPAYAGVEGHSVVFAMYKKQWANVNGGPVQSHVTFHVPLKGGLAFGAAAFNDSEGILNSTSGKVTGGYLVSIDREHFIRFGLSIGAGTRSINSAEFDSQGDPAFAGFENSNLYLIGDFGVTYHFGHFNVGVSLPKLFDDVIATEEGIAPIGLNPQDNMLFKINYRGHITHDIAFEPHLIYRYSKFLPNQYEATGIVHLKHIAWIGATYRQDAGIVALLGAKVKDQLGIGIAYELGNSNLSSELGPTFEIHLGYHIARKHHSSHAHSFIKSYDQDLRDKAAKEKEALANLRARENTDPVTDPSEVQSRFDRLQETTQDPVDVLKWDYTNDVKVEKEDIDGTKIFGHQLQRTNKGAKEVVVAFPPPALGGEPWDIANKEEHQLLEREKRDGSMEVGVKWIRLKPDGSQEEVIKWEPIMTPAQAAAAATISKTDPIETDPIETDPIQTDPIDTPDTPDTPDISYKELVDDPDSHLEVKRGNNLLELPAGTYLIGGVFDDFDTAEELSDDLFNDGFRNTRVGYVTARGHYYVVIETYDSVEAAQRAKQSTKSSSGLSDVWVLKVSE